MNQRDPLASWRRNPFFILGVSTEALPAEIERAGQKLLGLLALGSEGAARYDSPFGPATRDADDVRQALGALRDPKERIVHELWANVASSHGEERLDDAARPWAEAERALGWTGRCPE